MKTDIKSIGLMLLFAILFAVTLRILMPIPIVSLIAFIIFMLLLEISFQVFEKESAIKRGFSKIKVFAVGIILYLGLRIIFGHLFGMPLVDAVDETNKIGFFNFLISKKLPENIVLEIAFMLPALGLTYWFVTGGKRARGFLWTMSFILFMVILWQIKQPGHNLAMERFAKATIGHHASKLQMESFIKETEAATTWVGLGDVPINAVYDIEYNQEGEVKFLKTIKTFNGKPIYDILSPHTVVQMADPNQKPLIYKGQNFIQIKLPDETGNFVHSRKVHIPASYVTLEKGWPKGMKAGQNQKDYIECGLGPSPSYILKPGEFSPFLRGQNNANQIFQSKYGKYKVCFRNNKCYSPNNTPTHSLSDFRFQGITNCDVRAFFEL
ncbi:hypothetical protein DRH27_02280 [Candidatus Falkowbacteria bacterium]|nr:MAG: hypothetical protein DRH27_02280 [Candidatus Falkowbacteria bacterium]